MLSDIKHVYERIGGRYLKILPNFKVYYLDNLLLADHTNLFLDKHIPRHNGHLVYNNLQNLFSNR